MAALDRDAILQALFDRLQAKLAGDVKTFTRRLETYHNAPLQPALVLLSERHTAATDLGAPPVWRMTAEVLIYLETIEADASPETRLNALVHLVEEALERDPAEARPAWGGDYFGTSLGGLCSSCVVTGVELGQGTEGGQAEASITIAITAAIP
jgi:hypothetical protein